MNYVLQKSSKSKPFVAHADKLKKCYSLLPEVEEVAVDNTEVKTTVEPVAVEDWRDDTLGARVHQRQRPVHPPGRFLD